MKKCFYSEFQAPSDHQKMIIMNMYTHLAMRRPSFGCILPPLISGTVLVKSVWLVGMGLTGTTTTTLVLVVVHGGGADGAAALLVLLLFEFFILTMAPSPIRDKFMRR